MFDLEKAITSWRRNLRYNRAFLQEDIDELERHVRDQVAALVKGSLSEKEAFRHALEDMGDYVTVESEYGKVYWGKLKRSHQLKNEILWRLTMLKNYFTIALRNCKKQQAYTFINIFGLAIGLTCFILISLFVQFELSYDTFHDKADRIYRVAKEDPGSYYLGSNRFAVTPAPLTSALMKDLPEVEIATQIDKVNAILEYDGTRFYEDGIYATEHFFDVFNFPLLYGDPSTVLDEPNTIILTETVARKYFGETDPMGQSLSFVYYDDKAEMKVVGIVEDVPANSHFTFDYIISMQSYGNYQRNLESWGNSNYLTYAVLRPDHSVPDFDAKLTALAQKYHRERPYYQEHPDEITAYYPQALTDIHLRSHINFEFGINSDVKYVYLFAAIGLLILLIACINYMNLATARSVTRAREVGVRKVMGAHRAQLIGQFMGEALILSGVALFFALLLAKLFLPTFNMLTAREMTLFSEQTGSLLITLVAIGLGVGLLSGSYPALMMSSFHPVQVMKGGLQRGRGKATLRNVLVVTQFAITIALIVGTLVIQQQLRYIQNANTGVDRDHVVSIPIKDRAMRSQYTTLKQTLERHPNVAEVTASRHDPTNISSQSGSQEWEGVEEGQHISVYNTGVMDNFIDVFGLDLVEGRNFSETRGTDERDGILINETMARQLGWDTAIGKWFTLHNEEQRVIGVVRDFNFHSFHQEMAPLMLYLDTDHYSRVLVKVRPEDMQETIAFLGATMAQFSPDYPFDYHFLDDAYNRMYQTETRLGRLFSYFTTLALLIACLGLLGLATFTAAQRTKEIGVRKVLGATLSDILVLLSKDFIRLIAIAFVLGTPFAYFAMNTWLQDFAYRIEISWPIFLIAGLIALLVTFLTISYQSIKVARTNPVDTLRHE